MHQPMKSIALSGMVLLMAGWSLGQNLALPRLWVSQEGTSFRGTFQRLLPSADLVEITDAEGVVHRIPLDKLSDADQALVLESPLFAPPAEGYRELPGLDRSTIPVISQGDYGRKQSDCVPSSFCNFVLWWDQQKALEIPKRGDFDKKAEWVHTVMARLCVTRNNTGTYLEAAKQGFVKYFDTELTGGATFNYREDFDLRPENIARYTVGANATMLGLTVLDGRGKGEGHWVALVSASPTGKLVFHTWGARFEGEMKVLEANPQKVCQVMGHKVPATTYEIKLANPQLLPQSVRENGIRFVLDPSKGDGVFTVRPLVPQEAVEH